MEQFWKVQFLLNIIRIYQERKNWWWNNSRPAEGWLRPISYKYGLRVYAADKIESIETEMAAVLNLTNNKVILQTELSHLGQNWQRFEISPLQGYIADGIELLGTKMAAVIWQKKTAFWMGTLSNLYISMLFCSQNPARAHFQISVLQGYFADRIWNLGRKWAHLQILVLKGYFAVRIHHLNWKWHTFKSLYYKCAHFCCSFLHLTSIVSWKMMMTWKTCSNAIKIAFWDKHCKSHNLCQWKV